MQQMSGGSMSGKVRVYEVAKQLNLDPKQVVGLFQAIGVADVRNHMSSVEPEAVERVKRHLEKQRTHDVVEERIRPGVLKRRAVAKASTASSPAGADAPSTPAIPSAAPSARVLDEIAPSTVESNGHTASEVLAGREAAQPSAQVRAPAAPSGAPASARAPHAVEPSRPSVVDDHRAAAAEPASVPRDRASVRTLVEEPSSQQGAEPARAPAAERPTDDAVAAAAPAPVHETVAPAPPPPAAAPPIAAPAPSIASAVATEPSPPPARPATAPKTGVEYWGGRPGVPMPAPSAATSSRGATQPNMPRRVQYDPRAGSVGAPSARRDVRAPGQQPGRPMMGRSAGGAGPRRQSGPMPPRKPPIISTQEMSAHKKVIRIENDVTLQTMAQRMSLKATELLMKLLSMGMSNVHINTTLDADTAKILASEFGWEVEDVGKSEEQTIAEARGEEEKPVEETTASDMRPPVVTVMGHVDHGKTSLLDRIRKANVAGGEAGGITQHIGAYKVETKQGTVVFLDTPGHEAFTQMRARGASVTDIVVLVVAADDGVMPQTKEAIAHAKAAKVPIIVAVNKIDKPNADPERVKRELVEQALVPEDWGGDTLFVNVSAVTGEGVERLLESIQLQSEILELKANPKRSASGTVLEALLDRGRGPVARVLVQDGTLKVGDFVLAGAGFGKVRAMTNEHGKQVHEAGPATPVEILGLNEVPNAGDRMDAVKDPKKAQEIAESRRGKMAKNLIPATAKVSLEELSKRIAESGQEELRVIIKGDVQGSVEALADALAKLSSDKVKLAIINAAVGAITEGDVNLAIASKAIIVGFNVRPAGKAAALAEENKIEIRMYSIIYNALEDVKAAMEGLLPPTLVEKQHGKAEVRQLFKVKGTSVAGCHVIEGKIVRSGKVRLVRDGVVVWDGKIGSLKRFKDDVREVVEGFECGISLDGYNDLKEKDVLECYEVEEIKQKL
ncbi:MAG TPA: translation initiation factor IF-2 [Polyangiaceae bacterium]|nr:translation initiation factor IF-2 [Polyangiaceae bacterium]